MGTIIGILIGFLIGVATGIYISRKMREALESELQIERGFNGTTPAPAAAEPTAEDKAVNEIDAFLEQDAEEQREIEANTKHIPVTDSSKKTIVKVTTPPTDQTYIIQPRDTWAGVARKIGAKQIDLIKLDKDPRFGFTITRKTNGDISYESRFPRLKNQDGATLVSLIADQGEEAWISKTTANKALGWGFNRFKKALEYLQRNRYIKTIDEKKNRGAKYAVKAK